MSSNSGVFFAGKGRLSCRARPASDGGDAILHRKIQPAAHRKAYRGYRRFAIGAIALLSASLITGCGQKGPLHLPGDQARIGSPSVSELASPEEGASRSPAYGSLLGSFVFKQKDRSDNA
ncbi:LPS translocon maturation chaperone LptM [Thioalkalivibrio sp. HK1]|uniref:LPS translocon maturation chaperone LptM n=1 Tax=Thioalkalivibrio sp. HK1 TaxID=1469245 RepID=UPI0012DE63BA|nr:lipoprotein [Thioalkalivibrio sp. HK1]